MSSKFLLAAGRPLPAGAFEHAIAYEGKPTTDGRLIVEGSIDWQFGMKIPLTAAFEGGQIIGYVIPSHIDEAGAVMATVCPPSGVPIGSLGVGLDQIEASIDNGENPSMTITDGRLRHVAVQPAESAAWPGTVVNHG